MPLTLQLKYSGRSFTVQEVDNLTTVAEFQKVIAQKTGCLPEQQLLKFGVPPKELSSELGDAVSLLDVGLSHRDTVLVECREMGKRKKSSSSEGEQSKRQRIGTNSTNVRTETSLRDDSDPKAADLLPALDRAIASTSRQVGATGEDKHQVWALRKAKTKIIESIKSGNNISLSALHTLSGVGHWVVQQIKDHLSESSCSNEASNDSLSKMTKKAPPATPSNFTWSYLDQAGKKVKFRNDAEMSISPNGPVFRVSILHSSGRMEKAWLPDAKAPPESAST